MAIHIQASESQDANSCLIPFTKNNVDQKVVAKHTGIQKEVEHSGASKEMNFYINPDSGAKVTVLGIGEEKDAIKAINIVRSIVYHHRLKTNSTVTLNVILDHLSDAVVNACIIGLRYACYNHGLYKTESDKFFEPLITVVLSKERHQLANDAIGIAETQLSIMNLVDQPSNIKTPEYIGEFAKKSGIKYGYNVDVYKKEELVKMGLNATLSVGQGSVNDPVLIVMEYKPKSSNSKSPKLGMVGKGISFDTGGISLKRAANMGYMKCDMGGGAAVIGAMELAAKMQLDIHIVGVVPAAENSIDANSIRPGDVIHSFSGKSIEVIDTDAEGRLVLADGIEYIMKHFAPEYLIDVATLTGSCIAALGYHAAGLFTHNDEMSKDLEKAGDSVNERLWRLPIWEDYMSDMQSDIADIKNLGGKPVAGAITAAKFVEYFTSNHPKWAHLDIAGVAFNDTEYAKMRTASAFGVRLLVSYMEGLITKK